MNLAIILFGPIIISSTVSSSDHDSKTAVPERRLLDLSHDKQPCRKTDSDNDFSEICSGNVTEYSLADCISYKCMSPEDVLIYYNMSMTNVQSVKMYQEIVPAEVASLVSRFCFHQSPSNHGMDPGGTTGRHKRSTPAEAWGYGLAFVVVINCISMVGAVMVPIMNQTFFKNIIMTLVVLGVGAMAGTSIFVLIPEMFDLMNIDEVKDKYKWKATTLVVSIYVFYIWEQAMRLFEHWKLEKTAKEAEQNESAEEKEKIALEAKDKPETDQNPEVEVDIENTLPQHGHSHGEVKTVAWVVLCADAIHKFVDGLSIGASFTKSVGTGLSVSVAILCEELPHELGDIAILVHSGLKMKKALLYNMLVALPCFAGLVVGIMLSEAVAADKWIFAIAGGVFMYIALVDMLPEIRTADERDPQFKTIQSKIKLCLMQNLGLLAGFAIIFVLVTVFN